MWEMLQHRWPPALTTQPAMPGVRLFLAGGLLGMIVVLAVVRPDRETGHTTRPVAALTLMLDPALSLSLDDPADIHIVRVELRLMGRQAVPATVVDLAFDGDRFTVKQTTQSEGKATQVEHGSDPQVEQDDSQPLSIIDLDETTLRTRLLNNLISGAPREKGTPQVELDESPPVLLPTGKGPTEPVERYHQHPWSGTK